MSGRGVGVVAVTLPSTKGRRRKGETERRHAREHGRKKELKIEGRLDRQIETKKLRREQEKEIE